MILSELSNIERAEYLLRMVTDLHLPLSITIEVLDKYDGIESDGEVPAVEIDGLYWLYWAEGCIEVPTIAGPRTVDGWVLETIDAPGWISHDGPPPIPEVDRKAQSLDDIVAELIGRIAKSRTYQALYTEMSAADSFG